MFEEIRDMNKDTLPEDTSNAEILQHLQWAMFLLGIIPFKRMDSRSQLDCLKRCMDLIKKGASIFFFPEGTRSKDGRLGTFKLTTNTTYYQSNVPQVTTNSPILAPETKKGP
ncbi:hypothetical protein JHK84_049758 [Glycine max]|nr:hypothetical protein JHK86_049722 [Glycine max]KAG5094170.1 hypothetical protein JHK84_049758 [Glycine max]